MPLPANELAELPPLPTAPGWYIFHDGQWKKTDQLTYRTWYHTAEVKG